MKEAIFTYLSEHPLYIPFLVFNVFIIYRVILIVIRENYDDDNDDDDDGGILPDGPDLDLPPGVSLPVEPSEVEPEVVQ